MVRRAAAPRRRRPHLPDETADRTLRRLLAEQRAVVAAREPAARKGSTAALHDVRVALRRLRYLSEFFAADLGRDCVRAGHWITKAQAALGKVHDCDSALELSLELPTGRARAAVRKHLRARRAAQLRKFKTAWRHYADRRLQKAWRERLEVWAGT